jgi:hypothetical protein
MKLSHKVKPTLLLMSTIFHNNNTPFSASPFAFYVRLNQLEYMPLEQMSFVTNVSAPIQAIICHLKGLVIVLVKSVESTI